MRYASVCSGIEAPSVAWRPLAWTPAYFSEIEPFPSAVLAHHHPSVPNLGDMTKFRDWPDAAIDLLVGGTPCQSFSVAGLRKGMADPRGNLALTYLGIANRYRPKWLVWENVPGVLSSNGGRDFGAFLGGMVELGYGFAYRVLDAQYVRVDGFGRAVPQRRRRVFVVGHLGNWRPAAAVLFEPESLRGNSSPRREAGQAVAPTISARPTGGGGLGTDFDLDGGLIAFTSKDHGQDAAIEVSPALRAMSGLHANAGGQVAIAWGIRSDANRSGEAKTASADAEGRVRLRNAGFNVLEGLAPTVDTGSAHTVVTPSAVRRLTPTECERLQGFPDDYTLIGFRKRPAADGPRYKALGNSMAVNVMRWLGRRIDVVDRLRA